MPLDQEKYGTTLYNPEWLRQKYVVERLSCREIAELIGCTQGAVNDRLKRYGIPIRSHSENTSNQAHPGSHAPRKKKSDVERFKNTLDNDDWMRAHSHWNASEIAKKGKCSVPKAQESLRRIGIEPPDISTAKAGRASTKRMSDAERKPNRAVSSRKAHQACPPAMCSRKGCSAPGTEVNHITRNWANNAPDNLERLCSPCHRRQYAAENEIMFQLITENGQNYEAFRPIYEAACKLVESGPLGHFKGKPLGSLEYGGQIKTISQWALEVRISAATIRSRLEKGWGIKEALTTPPRRAKKYLYNGIEDTLFGHAERSGIGFQVVYGRVIRQKWPLERALSIPIRQGDPVPTLSDEEIRLEEGEEGEDEIEEHKTHLLDSVLANRPLKPPAKRIELEGEMDVQDLLERLDTNGEETDHE